MHVHLRGHKRASDPLGLELEMAGSHHLGARDRTQVLEEQPELLLTEPVSGSLPSSCCGDPNHEIISLLVDNCSFATLMNHNVNI